jgi:hypothetical protein
LTRKILYNWVGSQLSGGVTRMLIRLTHHKSTTWRLSTQWRTTTGNTTGSTPITSLPLPPPRPGNQAAATKDTDTGNIAWRFFRCCNDNYDHLK